MKYVDPTGLIGTLEEKPKEPRTQMEQTAIDKITEKMREIKESSQATSDDNDYEELHAHGSVINGNDTGRVL